MTEAKLIVSRRITFVVRRRRQMNHMKQGGTNAAKSAKKEFVFLDYYWKLIHLT